MYECMNLKKNIFKIDFLIYKLKLKFEFHI